VISVAATQIRQLLFDVMVREVSKTMFVAACGVANRHDDLPNVAQAAFSG
jgi:hypothetical protein